MIYARIFRVLVLFMLAAGLVMWYKLKVTFLKIDDADEKGKYLNQYWNSGPVQNGLAVDMNKGYVLDNFESLIRKNTTEINANVPLVQSCIGRKYLVYECTGCPSGWGDRQKGIISSYLLALLTNRTFAINIPSPCDIKYVLQPNIYNWTKCISHIKSFETNETMTVNSMNAKRVLLLNQLKDMNFDESWKERVIVMNINHLLIDQIRIHPKCREMINWLLKTPNENVIKFVLSLLYKPNSRLTNELNDFIAEHKQQRQMVCSHIRIGKNPSIPHDGSLHGGKPNVSIVLSFLDQYNTSSDYVVYVATDSEEIRHEAQIRFPNMVSVNRTIVHVGRSRTGGIEACEGVYTMIFEQTLLSTCDVLILTRSNFGAMAAYMRGSSDNLYMYHKESRAVKNVTVFDIQTMYGFV